jgi:hypothetical protein
MAGIMTTCTCGRPHSHCRFCGSRNLYPAKYKSELKKALTGLDVTVHQCKKCGADTDESLVCQAPSFVLKGTSIVPPEKPRPPIGTDEYLEAAIERLTELKTAGLDNDKAVLRMKSEGWVFEEPKEEPPQEIVIEPTSNETEITLDTVLEKMKEQAAKDAKRDTNIDLEGILQRMKKK